MTRIGKRHFDAIVVGAGIIDGRGGGGGQWIIGLRERLSGFNYRWERGPIVRSVIPREARDSERSARARSAQADQRANWPSEAMPSPRQGPSESELLYAHIDSVYVDLVRDSTSQIRELEKKRGEQMIIMADRGGVLFGGKQKMEKMAATLSRCNLKSELLTAQQVRERYPEYHYGEEFTALVDPNMGLLLADRWISAFQGEFLEAGGTVSEHTKVNGFKEGKASVTLNTDKGDFTAPKVVFALGSWINKLLPELPVKGRTEILSVCYWAPKDPADLPLVTPQRHAVHSAYVPDGPSFFSMGSVDVEGAVKFMLHGGQEHFDTDVPVDVMHERFVEDVRKHIEKHMPSLDTVNGPVKVERCKYTMSPDAHYVIDFFPGSKNIHVAGCMSGHGFKNAPGVGRAVAQLASGENPFTDLSFFSLDRFKKND